ncbi:MAG: sigma factor, partial [Gemmobacter sp.]
MTRRRPDLTAHLEALRRYARVLARNGMEADDLVQGALLRAVERLHQWREDGNLRVWLLSILHNHFVDTARAQAAAAARDGAWAGLA